MVTLYTLNNKLVKVGSKFYGIITEPTPPEPPDEVTIGTQTWKTKNLAINDGGSGIYTQTVNYGQGDVVEYYYTWDAAVRIANSIEGWHLPSSNEWNALASAVGGSSTAGTKLKSTYGWTSGNGTDDYGFAAFPAGARYSSGFSSFGTYANFWSSTSIGSTVAYYKYFKSDASMHSHYDSRSSGNSVRLIKDS